jgi:hypothetical protein
MSDELNSDEWREISPNYWTTIPSGSWVKYVYRDKDGEEKLKYGGLYVESFTSERGTYIKLQSTMGKKPTITIGVQNIVRLYKKKDYNDAAILALSIKLEALERQQVAMMSRMGAKRSSETNIRR